MQILLVEDDEWMVDLITLLLRNAFPQIEVVSEASVESGLEAWKKMTNPGLLICDWRLNGLMTGDELVSRIRREDDRIPVVMLTAHQDRQLIRRLGRLGVNEYLLKPFQHDDLVARVRNLLEPAMSVGETSLDSPELQDWLSDIDHVLETVPNLASPVPEIEDVEQIRAGSASELATAWRHNSGVVERLIRSANRMLRAREGQSVSRLRDAITVLGVHHAVDLVMAAALGQREAYPSEALAAQAEQLEAASTRVAHAATQMALQANMEPRLAFTAGILHNLGDKAVLAALCYYHENIKALADEDILPTLRHHAPRFGNRLKIKWQLPLELRTLMGAAYVLPRDHVTRQQLVLRLARSLQDGDVPVNQMQRWARQAGVDETLVVPQSG